MLEPIVRTIEVPCGRERAFDVFLEMDSWWPMGKFTVSAMRGDPARSIRADAREGGEIVEVGSDGQEVKWGEFRIVDRPDYLAMRFHIPHPDYMEAGDRTLVEVRFTSLDEGRTRVELKQSDFEGLGDMAEQVHGGYGHGWTMIFENAYRGACGD